MAATKAKIRTLAVRPIKSADLAFQVSGVLSAQSLKARLGRRVGQITPIDHSAPAETTVEEKATAKGSRDLSDSAQMHRELSADALFMLRNHRMQADLDQALAQYQADFLEKYAEAEAIAKAVRDENASRVAAIQAISRDVSQRHTEIAAEYKASQRTGVVRQLYSQSRHEGDAAPLVRTFSAPMQLSTPGYGITINGGGMPGPMTHTIPEVLVNPKTFRGGTFQAVSEELTATLDGGGNAKVTGVLTQVTQTDQRPVVTSNDLPEYSHPALDDQIATQAALAELKSEEGDRLVRGLRIQSLQDILHNQDRAALQEVRKRQAALEDTYLMAPFDGLVTAIYKDVGEFVQAGEPVMRVESDSSLLLVGYVQCKRLVEVGQVARLIVNNIFESGDVLRMTGVVVAVRGHDADDDEWDVVIEVENRVGQQVTHSDNTSTFIRLPLNLHFDKYETVLSLTDSSDGQTEGAA